MKDNLEKAFKEKLDNFEAPYDASAWESMNSRLDAQQGAGGKSILKWIAGSAAVLAVLTVATYYFTQNEGANTIQQAEINSDRSTDKSESNDQVVSTQVKENEEAVTSTNDVSSTPIEANNSEESIAPKNNDATNVNIEEQSPVVEEQSNEDGSVHSTDTQGPLENVQRTGSPDGKPEYNFIAGKLMNKKVCKGESIFIKNIGAKNDIIKIQINDEVLSLKKAHFHEYTPEESGTIFYLDGDNNVINKENFTVLENPNPEFSLKANVFENGLPVTICETYGDYASVHWSFDDEHKAEGRKVTHNFFKKGEHQVSLTVSDFNGCENTLIKTVRIEENYNLMAVDAFKPNGADPRNKVFMPFALTQRDVNFTLTIVDPRDNSVVFSSQDATNGWDGRDERTGKMTPSATAYIWKVQLENALPNERQVYAGTVVHN